jgi:exopolysaccharide biosynthesis polyprenyl glycosylphosphotransferase
VLGRIAARAYAIRVAPKERCFFVGDPASAERLRAKLEQSRGSELVGYIADRHVQLSSEDLRALVEQLDVQRMIISSGLGTDDKDTMELVRAAKAVGLRVTISPNVLAVVGSSLVLDDVWGMPLLGIPRFGLTRSSAFLKRSFDVVGATAALVLVSPLLLLFAVLISLDTRGPVLFRQRRIGRDGTPFEILKFRTMVADAEHLKADLRALNEADGIFKMKTDPRVTRVGRLLRKTSLDELPQLVNVLRGEMSLVGPRPLVVDEDELITGLDRRRLAITPGMTGPWQILGSARVPLHEMIKLDYVYVANWSLWADVKILLRTAAVVVGRRGL